jgi:tRNA nucleotidyltransferase (CCA-adding enzyme)
MKAIEEFVRGLGLDAYVVGGAVRDDVLGRDWKDADFLVAGVDMDGLRAALDLHGKVEELVVANHAVGLRLHPRDRGLRALAPAGIEFAPPRRERSTGPGRHDFEIVVDATASVEDDLRRRDFTINAMARRLSDGELVDPCDGRDDLERGVLRTVSPRSFAEDPLRLVRGLRFVSQLGIEPDAGTLAQMHEEAPAVALISAERLGGGLAADGMGELSKLLLGSEPRKALRLARDTGVLAALIPEYGPAIGFDSRSKDHDLTLEEHVFAVVQAAADEGAPLRLRLATLLHDLGKPGLGSGLDHAAAGAELADHAMRRLRYSNELREQVVKIVRYHPFLLGDGDPVEARRFLARYGPELAVDLVDHWRADLTGRDQTAKVQEKLRRVARFRTVVEGELGSAYRLSELAVDGTDLLELGYRPGPALGRALEALLDDVVVDPGLNRRDALLERAGELLRA